MLGDDESAEQSDLTSTHTSQPPHEDTSWLVSNKVQKTAVGADACEWTMEGDELPGGSL